MSVTDIFENLNVFNHLLANYPMSQFRNGPDGDKHNRREPSIIKVLVYYTP